ncbi:hypothetical protein GCM10027290_28450 [Micromonospora sonneratiae]|uniref:DUF2267 domain-containing protein n=1 Tax=Micromonospora sonneratiae TaxID=1184706 RepID=A0ABW3Y7B4_9ACTN
MNYDTFIDLVAQRARVPSEQAVDLTRATLETLADRLTSGEVLDLAVQLPKPLQTTLRKRGEARESFGVEEFTRRVGVGAGVDEATAGTGLQAVFTTLREAVSGGEFDEVMTQLPGEYRDLVAPSMMPGGVLRDR